MFNADLTGSTLPQVVDQLQEAMAKLTLLSKDCHQMNAVSQCTCSKQNQVEEAKRKVEAEAWKDFE
jgi:hypothetical protein